MCHLLVNIYPVLIQVWATLHPHFSYLVPEHLLTRCCSGYQRNSIGKTWRFLITTEMWWRQQSPWTEPPPPPQHFTADCVPGYTVSLTHWGSFGPMLTTSPLLWLCLSNTSKNSKGTTGSKNLSVLTIVEPYGRSAKEEPFYNNNWQAKVHHTPKPQNPKTPRVL